MEEKINTRFRYIRLNRHPIGVLVTQDAGNNNVYVGVSFWNKADPSDWGLAKRTALGRLEKERSSPVASKDWIIKEAYPMRATMPRTALIEMIYAIKDARRDKDIKSIVRKALAGKK